MGKNKDNSMKNQSNQKAENNSMKNKDNKKKNPNNNTLE